MASFASLGDVIIAEPKSMIGFAGPRVIKETTHQDLPERFQTAEFLEEHGLIDMIVHRKKLRDEISQLLGYFAGRRECGRGLSAATSSSYKEALAWLYSLQRFGIKLGLENMRRLIDELSRSGGFRAAVALPLAVYGAQEIALPWKVIHVAGTNGKGSVCAMIDSICRAQGYRTGLFTSPHLVTFRERIRVNGEMISERRSRRWSYDNTRSCRRLGSASDVFRSRNRARAETFSRQDKIDIVILETGLGGRLDATNAVQSDVAVITPIGLDHQELARRFTRQDRGRKSRNYQSEDVRSCQRRSNREAEQVIRARAAECEAPLQFVHEPYDEVPVALRGDTKNKMPPVAIAAMRAAKIELDETAIARGLLSVEWPARFQTWDERTIIDGAHNPAAARILAETWREIFGDARATLILAVLADKDLRGICEALAPIAGSVILPKIRSERAVAPAELAKIFFRCIRPSLPPLHHFRRLATPDDCT